MTQGKLQPELFDQWLHIMALGQAQNQQNWSGASNHVIMIKKRVRIVIMLLLLTEISSLQASSWLLDINTCPTLVMFYCLISLCYASLCGPFTIGYYNISAPVLFNWIEIRLNQLSPLLFLNCQYKHHTANLIWKILAFFGTLTFNPIHVGRKASTF